MPARKHSRGSTSVTMRDVAKLANVSQSTVSRVLNNRADGIPIGEETRQRVLDAVQQLGYYPNLHAGSLRGQKTRMIAMMIADIANPVYHPLVRAVQDVARTHQYDVMVANTDHTSEGEHLFCESIIRRPVDGVVIAPYHLIDSDIDRVIARTGVAVAALGQHITHPKVDVVFTNGPLIVHEAMRWLVEQKEHRRIGFIGVTTRFSAGERRRQAFLEAMAEVGLAQPEDYFQQGDWSAESGLHAMRSLLSLPALPTAVFACNDLMAIGAMEAAGQMGLRIPQDVAVMGFDDVPAASWVRPRLTTIAQYPEQMGAVLAKALFQRIDGNQIEPSLRLEVPCQFIEREST
jgi:DNA-binding LacI/PurR family transcriptional regulator